MTGNLNQPGVNVLYRDDVPYYIGKTSTTLLKRLSNHALKPNARRYNFKDPTHRDEIEAILISAMPTANSSEPKFQRKKLDPRAARLLSNVQALMLTGKEDTSGESKPEEIVVDEED
jgi:hypothetical protein